MIFNKKREISAANPLSVEALMVGKLLTQRDFAKELDLSLSSNDSFVQEVARNGIEKLANELPRGTFEDHLRGIFDSGRSCIFAVPHWGNYVKSFIHIGLASDGGHFVALRRDQWGDDESTMYKKVNDSNLCTIDIARTDRNGLIRFVKALRKGNYGLTCFDLHHEFGDTKKISVLNYDFHFSYKWIDIAWKTDSFVCFLQPWSDSQGKPKVLNLLDPDGHNTQEEFTNSVLSAGSEVLEFLLCASPTDWYMWHLLEQFALSSSGDLEVNL